ncbi:MAG: phosphotransferase [Anaerolineae bacterium]|nr:phosphotransferase [Anaerolineae bacterium]
MKPFDQVTRLTQRKRWRRLGEIALRRYGIENARLRFVSDTGNVVFRVDTPEKRYALRIDPEPANAEFLVMVEAEMCWLAVLRQDTTLIVPEPVAAQDGTLVPVVSTAGVPGAHLVTLLRWMPGQLVGDRPAPATMEQMGAFMAHLHDHTEQFSFPDGITRPRTDWRKLAYWTDPQNDTSTTLTPKQRDLCAWAAKRLLADIEQIGTDRDYSLIHADLHPNNCLLCDGQLGVVDFADCRFGSHFYDMSVPLTYLAEHDDYETLRAAFYEGYNRIRLLPKRTESAVQIFMVARAFDHIEWIHLDWPSPTHHPWGPALLDSAIRWISNYYTGLT